MKKFNKKGLVVVALLLLVGISTSKVAGTYAKYTGSVEKEGTMTVAKWAFDDDNKASTMSVNLTKTADATTLVDDKIAPGTEGSFSININNANSETGVNFEVSVGEITNAPKNLVFYADAAMTQVLDADHKLTGTIVANDSTGVDAKIYWKWAYEQADVASGDTDDTTAGKAATSLTIPVVITGVQAQPSTSAITTGIN